MCWILTNLTVWAPQKSIFSELPQIDETFESYKTRWKKECKFYVNNISYLVANFGQGRNVYIIIMKSFF